MTASAAIAGARLIRIAKADAASRRRAISSNAYGSVDDSSATAAPSATMSGRRSVAPASITPKGSATIDRTSFGVGQGDYASTAEIAGPVAVSFDFQATARD